MFSRTSKSKEAEVYLQAGGAEVAAARAKLAADEFSQRKPQ